MAKHTITGYGFGVAFADHLIADPQDQNPRQKKRKVEANEPRKCDGNHDFFGSGVVVAAGAPQSRRTRPQLGCSAG